MHSQEAWEFSMQVYLAISLWVGGGGKRPLNSCKITIYYKHIRLVQVQRKDNEVLGSWMAKGQLQVKSKLRRETPLHYPGHLHMLEVLLSGSETFKGSDKFSSILSPL